MAKRDVARYRRQTSNLAISSGGTTIAWNKQEEQDSAFDLLDGTGGSSVSDGTDGTHVRYAGTETAWVLFGYNVTLHSTGSNDGNRRTGGITTYVDGSATATGQGHSFYYMRGLTGTEQDGAEGMGIVQMSEDDEFSMDVIPAFATLTGHELVYDESNLWFMVLGDPSDGNELFIAKRTTTNAPVTTSSYQTLDWNSITENTDSYYSESSGDITLPVGEYLVMVNLVFRLDDGPTQSHLPQAKLTLDGSDLNPTCEGGRYIRGANLLDGAIALKTIVKVTGSSKDLAVEYKYYVTEGTQDAAPLADKCCISIIRLKDRSNWKMMGSSVITETNSTGNADLKWDTVENDHDGDDSHVKHPLGASFTQFSEIKSADRYLTAYHFTEERPSGADSVRVSNQFNIKNGIGPVAHKEGIGTAYNRGTRSGVDIHLSSVGGSAILEWAVNDRPAITQAQLGGDTMNSQMSADTPNWIILEVDALYADIALTGEEVSEAVEEGETSMTLALEGENLAETSNESTPSSQRGFEGSDLAEAIGDAESSFTLSLEGQELGETVEDAEASFTLSLSGQSNGETVEDATISPVRAFVGIENAESTVDALASTLKGFTGTENAEANVDAQLEGLFEFAGEVSSETSTDAGLGILFTFSGVENGEATITAALIKSGIGDVTFVGTENAETTTVAGFVVLKQCTDVVTDLDTDLATEVEELFNELGRSATFIAEVKTYNKTTGDVSTIETPTVETITPPATYKNRFIDGTLIRRGDVRVFIRSTYTPVQGQKVEFDNTTWDVAQVRTVYSGKNILFYELALRGGHFPTGMTQQTDLDIELYQDVLEVINDVGKSINFLVADPVIHYPETGNVSPESGTFVCVLGTPPVENQEWLDGTLISTNEIRTSIAANGLTFDPNLVQKVRIDNTDYDTFVVRPVYSGGQVVLWTFMLSK